MEAKSDLTGSLVSCLLVFLSVCLLGWLTDSSLSVILEYFCSVEEHGAGGCQVSDMKGAPVPECEAK